MTITTILTDRGRQILANRVPGDPPLASIKIAVGDGAGAFPSANPAQIALVNERWRGTGSASLDGARIAFSVNIPANVGGWRIREIGVFIGPVGAEELAIVSDFDGRYKPAAGENGASSLTPVVALDYTGSVVGAFAITLDPGLNPLDPSVHRTVVARVSAPPTAPTEGSAYAIASGATGEFAGKGGQIAKRRGTQWVFETAINGHVVREQGTAGAWWQKDGSDYVAYTFPVAAHNHDDRYHTEAEIAALLGGYVLKTGDVMSGPLDFVNGIPWRMRSIGGALTPGSMGFQIFKFSDGAAYVDNYDGDLIFRRSGNAVTARMKADGAVEMTGGVKARSLGLEGDGEVTLDLLDTATGKTVRLSSENGLLSLSQSGGPGAPMTTRLLIDGLGRVGIGVLNPEHRLQVAGSVVSRVSDNLAHLDGFNGSIELCRVGGGAFLDAKDAPGDDYDIRQTFLPSINLTEVTSAFRAAGDIDSGGGYKASNSFGTSNHVLTGGQPAQYRTLADLGHRHAIHAAYRAGTDTSGVVDRIGTTASSKGCSVSFQNISGQYRGIVTFTHATSDATYLVQTEVPVLAATTAGFILDLGVVGAPTTLDYSFTVII